MRLEGIERLRDRIQYCADQARARAGPGCEYSATLPDGRVQFYEITNLRDLGHLGHDVASWCVWIWSLKDFIRAEAQAAGKPSDWWKTWVEQSSALQITADLANREKHGGGAPHPWTSHDPRLGPARFTIHQSALGSLTFTADKVTIETADPQRAEYFVPVVDAQGNTLANALELLVDAMDQWDRAIAHL